MIWYVWLIYAIVGILAVLIVTLLLVFTYAKLSVGKCRSKARLYGKTTIVTGANSGIGYETALDFANRGAKVIVACRNPKAGKETVEKIIEKSNNKNVVFMSLDLSSLASVRRFAEEVNKSEERLDILVNNAGALDLPSKITEDGLQLMMQTNYFGPFLLTILLLGLIKKTSNSRIVNVSSVVAAVAWNFDVNALNNYPESIMKQMSIYSRTKLCNILFTIKLAEKLKDCSATTYSLHPGFVATPIFRNDSNLSNMLQNKITQPFSKTPRQGAQTSVYCSVAEGIEHLSGRHFEDCHVVRTYRTAANPALAERLWKTTEDILKLS